MLELGYKSPLLLFFFILHRHLFSIFPVILTEFSSRARNRYPRKYRVILLLSLKTSRYPLVILANTSLSSQTPWCSLPVLLMFILPTHNYRNCQASSLQFSHFSHTSIVKQHCRLSINNGTCSQFSLHGINHCSMSINRSYSYALMKNNQWNLWTYHFHLQTRLYTALSPLMVVLQGVPWSLYMGEVRSFIYIENVW